MDDVYGSVQTTDETTKEREREGQTDRPPSERASSQTSKSAFVTASQSRRVCWRALSRTTRRPLKKASNPRTRSREQLPPACLWGEMLLGLSAGRLSAHSNKLWATNLALWYRLLDTRRECLSNRRIVLAGPAFGLWPKWKVKRGDRPE